MSTSKFKIIKQCQHCGNMFEAQKITTAYCSHRCNSAHYKLKKRLELIHGAEEVKNQPQPLRPKVTSFNKAMIKEKEFLSVKDISALFECTPKTIYSLINSGKIKATNLSKRKTLIKRTEIDKLFN